MSRRLPLLSSAASTRNAGARSPVASTALSTVANAAVSIPMKPPVSPAQWNITDLLSELQSRGLRWQTDVGLSRVGGAGPSDHKALRLSGQTVMVPIFTHWAKGSPYEVRDEDGCTILYRDALRVEIESALASRDGGGLCGELMRIGVPASVVNTVPVALDHPHARHRAILQRSGRNIGLRSPCTLHGTPGVAGCEPPAFAADSEQIMRTLGYDEAQVRRLRESGALPDRLVPAKRS